MKNSLRAVAAAAAIMFTMPALAADLPAKAPAATFSGVYPFGASGLFAGIFTQGTGGSVSATVPGVGPASLTTTTAELGLTVGWAWGYKGAPVAYSLEGDFAVTNFNGNN